MMNSSLGAITEEREKEEEKEEEKSQEPSVSIDVHDDMIEQTTANSASSPFSQAMSDVTVSNRTDYNAPDMDEVMKEAMEKVETIYQYAQSNASLQTSTRTEASSMQAMFHKMKHMYSKQKSGRFARDVGQFDKTMLIIQLLRELDICLRRLYENESDALVYTLKCRYIVEKVAQVPDLMKAIMLLKNEEIRQDVLSLPIVIRVMLCKYSLWNYTTDHKEQEYTVRDRFKMATGGLFTSSITKTPQASVNKKPPQDSRDLNQSPSTAEDSNMSIPLTHDGLWLMDVLHSNSNKGKAVEYLEIVSSLTVMDYTRLPAPDYESSFRFINVTPTNEDIDAFAAYREEVFDVIASNQRVILMLFTLSDAEMERAGVTSAVQWLMSEAIRRPFIIMLVFCDLTFNLVLLLVYRLTLFEDRSISNGDNTSTAYTITTTCVWYFLFRALAEFALVQLSWSVFWRGLFYKWTLVEITSTVLVSISWGFSVTRTAPVQDRAYFYLQAFTIALLWVKLVSFLQIMNKKLAAYVHSIFEILDDMIWFVLLMIVVIFCFGDMLWVIYFSYRLPGPEGVSVCEEQEIESPFCTTNRGLSYLTIYRMFVGDLEASEFAADALSTIIFVLVTFIGVIVLLNMLIAIVTNSYDRATGRSGSLFAKARLAVIAKATALELLLSHRRKTASQQCVSIFVRLGATAVIIYGSVLVWAVTYEIFYAILKNISHETGRIVGITVALFVGIYLFLVIGAFLWFGWDVPPEEQSWCYKFTQKRGCFKCCLARPIRFIILCLLGEKPWVKRSPRESLNDEAAYKPRSDKKSNLSVFDEGDKDVTETVSSSLEEQESRHQAEMAAMEERLKLQNDRFECLMTNMEADFAERAVKHEQELRAMEQRIISALKKK